MNQTKVQQARLLLSPSWFSGLLSSIAGLAILTDGAAEAHYSGSLVQQALFAVHGTLAPVYRQLADTLAHNQFVNNIPLWLFWAVVGMIVYYLATGIYEAFQYVAELEDEIGYVHARRNELIKMAVLRTLLRFIFLGLWVGYVQLFLHIGLPYSLAAAYIAGMNMLSLNGLEYALLALVVATVSVHFHVVFLRLTLLRVRVFSSEPIEE